MNDSVDNDQNPFQPSQHPQGSFVNEQSDDHIEEVPSHIPLHKQFYLYFMKPSIYMKYASMNMTRAGIFLVIWIAGASSTIDSIQNKQLFGTSSPISIKSWAALFGVAITGGILRGFVIYGLGGVWFRLRLMMCGSPEAEWSQTSRVYMSAGIAKHLVALGIFTYASLMYDDLEDYIQNENTVSAMVTLALIMTFQVWSSFTLYAGVRSVFVAKRLWAIIWFLVLPILIRIGALAAILALVFIGTAVEPQLDSPSRFRSESFRFEYPSNWSVTHDTEVPGPETWVEVEPFLADAFIRVNVYESYSDSNLVQETLDSLLSEGSITLVSENNRVEQIAGVKGTGQHYTVEIDGSNYRLEIMASPLGDRSESLVMILCLEKVWEDAKPGFMHIVKTMKLTDPYELRPNLDRTMTAKQDELQFEFPSNWWLTNNRDESLVDDAGDPLPDALTIEAQTPGYGTFRIYVYNSTLGPRSELGITINNYTGEDQLDDEELISQWHGISGYGAKGKYQSPSDMEWNVTILISTLSDGRLIEFQSAYPTDHAQYYTPGYDLIERTLRVNPDFIDAP